MTKVVGRFVHRALCWVGIHSMESIYKLKNGPLQNSDEDFTQVGWWCQVCNTEYKL